MMWVSLLKIVFSKAIHVQIVPLPTPVPSQEGNKQVLSWEGTGVAL